MTALLDGLRFEGKVQPSPAAPIAGRRMRGDRPARRGGSSAGGGDAATIAMTDAAGEPAVKAARRRKPSPPGSAATGAGPCCRWGIRRWRCCRRPARTGLAAAWPTISALLVLYSDGGGVLEVVRLAKERKYLLLHHDIAEVKVLDSL